MSDSPKPWKQEHITVGKLLVAGRFGWCPDIAGSGYPGVVLSLDDGTAVVLPRTMDDLRRMGRELEVFITMLESKEVTKS